MKRPMTWSLDTGNHQGNEMCLFRALLLLSGLGPQDQAASWGAGDSGSVCAWTQGRTRVAAGSDVL